MQKGDSHNNAWPRRGLLKAGAATLLATCLPATAHAAIHPQIKPPAPPVPGDVARSLEFLNLHTGEKLNATYWCDGAYDAGACAEIDNILRDFRTGEIEPIDRRLFDLLYTLHRQLDADTAFHVISGYRSPKTNAALAAASNGVAKRSLHMRGMAIDIRLPGRELGDLRRAAMQMKAGGVGYYPKSDFVHVDVGRVRYW